MTRNEPILTPVFDAITGYRIPENATNVRTYHVTGPSGVFYENDLPSGVPSWDVYETTTGEDIHIATTRKTGETFSIIRDHSIGSYVGVSHEYHR